MVFLYLNLNAQNASIGDFQLPETKVERLFGSLNLNIQGEDTLDYEGYADLQYYRIYTSLPYSYNYGINVYTNRNTAYSDRNDTILPIIYYRFHSRLYGDIKKYINDESMFFYGGMFYSDLTIEDEVIFNTAKNDFQSKVGFGGGYGRIVPATGMAQALRIQEYLLDEKLITGEFTRETLIELSSHCARLYEYSENSGGRHPIEWYTDLEKILVATGKLDNNRFSPYALLRVQQILGRERIYERMIGWSVSGFINYINNYKGGNYYLSSNVEHLLGTTLKVEFGYPITNNLHFNHSTSYEYDNQILLNNDYNINHILSSSSIIYKLSNRFDFKIDYIFDSHNSSNYYKYQFLILNMYYYIENNIFLLLKASLTDRKDSYQSHYYYNRTHKDISLSFGYRFF
jgi:hypothetical protein